MLSVVEVLSASFDSGKRRLIKLLRMGREDIQECVQSSPAGVDSSPVKNMRAIYGSTTERGKNYVIGYLQKEQLAESGETRIFSVNDSGELKAWMWFKKDGTIEVLGDDDNLVKYSQTEASINELKDSLTELKQIFTSWTPVPNDGGAALKTSVSGWSSTPLIEDITGAKFDEVKTK